MTVILNISESGFVEKIDNQAGYTLIELLIALTLGLLIVAAAAQLFYGGVISVRLQQAGADIQNNGLFGLDLIAKDVRIANYGTTIGPITDTTVGGGVVLSQASVSSGTAISTCLITDGSTDSTSGCTLNQWQGLSNVQGLKSDQLTIQFQTPTAMTDCEGGQNPAGTQVIERYFLRVDTLPSPATDANLQNLVLACNAGTITPAGVITGSAGNGAFGGAGQVIMSRVDQFHVRLGTMAQDGTGNLAYYTINGYKNWTAPVGVTPAPLKPNILSVQVSVLVRSMDNTGNILNSPTKTFTLFDQTVTPIASASSSGNYYVRQIYLTTIALRNAMGVATS